MNRQILHGDCLDVMRDLPAGSVDAVITDPPYGIDYQSAWRTDKADWLDKISNDEKPFIWWVYDAARILKVGGAMLVFCRWDVQEPFRMAMELAGLDIRSQVIWDRQVDGWLLSIIRTAPRYYLVCDERPRLLFSKR